MNKMMKAVVIEEKGKAPVIKEIPIPTPLNGQVLVKMDSAPINPSDISFLYGGYSTSKPFPCVPGFEGSGTVLVNGYNSFLFIFFFKKKKRRNNGLEING